MSHSQVLIASVFVNTAAHSENSTDPVNETARNMSIHILYSTHTACKVGETRSENIIMLVNQSLPTLSMTT
jgi:hypothetical protein